MAFFGPQTLDLQDNHLRGRIVNKQTVGVIMAVAGLFALHASESRDGWLMLSLILAGLSVMGSCVAGARSLHQGGEDWSEPQEPQVSRAVTSEPWAFGFLAGIAVLLLAVLAIDSGCYLPASRWPVEQERLAVEVNSFCISSDPFGVTATHMSMMKGSGAILSATRVLTVQHVVDCDYLYDGHVELANGKRVRVRVLTQSKDLDLAVLEPVGGDTFTDVDVPTVVQPKIGMHVCAQTSVPLRWRVCGKIDRLDDLGTNSDVHFMGDDEDDKVEHGNSGSPMYDDYGHLVCAVTRLSSLGGGWCTSVHPHRDLLLH